MVGGLLGAVKVTPDHDGDGTGIFWFSLWSLWPRLPAVPRDGDRLSDRSES